MFGVPTLRQLTGYKITLTSTSSSWSTTTNGDPAGGWVHISYHESDSNRKQVLTSDGKKYTEGLPDMEWKDGKV